jgi:hypothetical protein
MKPFWAQVKGGELAQGDLLPDCLIPAFKPGFGQGRTEEEVEVSKGDLVIVTQSCDLENRKVEFVALCPIHSLSVFEADNPNYGRPSKWEEVRKGRVEGLHLLASPANPSNNRDALVVDFRQIVSLPFAYLTGHAASVGDRWRLESPFLEHFSQAFARFFMRVGLPSSVPAYKG